MSIVINVIAICFSGQETIMQQIKAVQVYKAARSESVCAAYAKRRSLSVIL